MLNQAIAKGNQNLVACCSPADVLFLLPAEWKSTNKGNEMKSKGGSEKLLPHPKFV
jgi:hypothetical protein